MDVIDSILLKVPETSPAKRSYSARTGKKLSKQQGQKKIVQQINNTINESDFANYEEDQINECSQKIVYTTKQMKRNDQKIRKSSSPVLK